MGEYDYPYIQNNSIITDISELKIETESIEYDLSNYYINSYNNIIELCFKLDSDIKIYEKLKYSFKRELPTFLVPSFKKDVSILKSIVMDSILDTLSNKGLISNVYDELNKKVNLVKSCIDKNDFLIKQTINSYENDYMREDYINKLKCEIIRLQKLLTVYTKMCNNIALMEEAVSDMSIFYTELDTDIDSYTGVCERIKDRLQYICIIVKGK